MIRKNNVIPGIYLCNENISDQNVGFWKICFKEIHFTPKCFFVYTYSLHTQKLNGLQHTFNWAANFKVN